jgi:uncharacterized membrane protein YccF (DUF307 family)
MVVYKLIDCRLLIRSVSLVQSSSFSQPPVTTASVSQSGPGCLVRVLWFFLVGWWAGLFWLHIGYVLCLSVIFLPIGLAMLNRLPAVLTLRPMSQQTQVTAYAGGIAVQITEVPQRSFLVRTLYFLLIGWWFGYCWAVVGYFCTLSLVLLPIGIVMLNRLPAVITLRRY